jgi:hypothetical protein
MAKDEERKFRLRPRKPGARSERRALAFGVQDHHALCPRERRPEAQEVPGLNPSLVSLGETLAWEAGDLNPPSRYE